MQPTPSFHIGKPGIRMIPWASWQPPALTCFANSTDSAFYTANSFEATKHFDPQLKKLFESELAAAETLAAKHLADDPVSVNALLAATMINGLRADYAALIERKDGASLSYTKKGRRSAEKLLMVDSSCYDAYLALGVENYLLGIKPAPVRWLLKFEGVNTNREKGLRELQLTAESGHFLKPFAKLLLAVAALRVHDDQKAKHLLAELHCEFPHNLLYESELARLEAERGD
jgi:hypothetical protein